MVSNPLTDPEWADRSVDFIDRMVSTVRKYTTQPLVTTARGIVFGLLGLFGFVSILVLLVIGLTRGLQAALDNVVNHDASVWISYFILSAVFFVIGLVLMRRRYTEE
jgi:small-conductance mechanosensitive channel